MLVRLQRTSTWQRTMEITQWVIPLVSFYFIWWIINSKTQQSNFLFAWTNAFKDVSLGLFIFGMLVFTSTNIFFESLKWKYSMNEFSKLSYQESIIQTLKAMAAGFITPFRSGAILARFIANENTDKKRIIDVTIQMATAQFTVTFFIGMTGLVYWLGMQGFWSYFYVTFFFTILAFGVASYYYFHPIRIHFRGTEWKGFSLNLPLVLISLARYTVFSLQYFILLQFFGVQIGFFHALSLISMTFLANTLLPSGILGKIGIRELSAILIIGETTGFLLEVSCAAFMIWLLNQALPAFIGSVLFLTKFTREH